MGPAGVRVIITIRYDWADIEIEAECVQVGSPGYPAMFEAMAATVISGGERIDVGVEIVDAIDGMMDAMHEECMALEQEGDDD